MGFGQSIKEAFQDVFKDLGGLESVPDIDRRGREEVRAEKLRRRNAASEIVDVDPDPIPADDGLADADPVVDPGVPDADDSLGTTSDPVSVDIDDDSDSATSAPIDPVDSADPVDPAQFGTLDPWPIDSGEIFFDDDHEDYLGPDDSESEPALEPITVVPEPAPEPIVVEPEPVIEPTIEEPEPIVEPTFEEPEPAVEPPSVEAPAREESPSVEAPEPHVVEEPEPPNVEAPEPAPESPVAPAILHVEGENEEPIRGFDSTISSFTGLARHDKAQLIDDYAIFADSQIVLPRLTDMMAGAIYAMDSDERDEFRRYLDAVNRSQLQICYRDALHKSPTIYATEELAMSAVTENFSESQHRYLEKALKSGAVKKRELVSRVYLETGDNGVRTEITREDYNKKIKSFSEDSDWTPVLPPLLEPKEVYSLVQSVEDFDQDRSVDDLVVRVMKQLVYCSADARRLAESTFADIDDMMRPIQRVVWEANGKEFNSYAEAISAVRNSGDSAFVALMSDEALASLVTRVEFTFYQCDGKRTNVKREPATPSSASIS